MAQAEKPQGNSLVVLLLALLGFLGIRAAVPDSSAPQQGNGNGVASEKGADKTWSRGTDSEAPEHFWQPVIDFRGPQPRESSKVLAQRLHIQMPFVGHFDIVRAGYPPEDSPDVDGWGSDFMIACVPHPFESSSGDRFDDLIDAIQRAVETDRFVLDRFNFPWRKKESRGGDRGPEAIDTAASGEHSRLETTCVPATVETRDRRHQPGMLLFRQAPPSRSPRSQPLPEPLPKLRQVLLVTETATAGIDKQAFEACLRYISRSYNYRTTHTINVLGPYFSGSQASLENAFYAWHGPGEVATTFRVISGNAAGILPDRLEHPGGANRVQFSATVLPSAALFRALLSYLNLPNPMDENKPGSNSKLNLSYAVLYESNTAFGQAAKPHHKARMEQNDKARTEQNDKARTEQNPEEPGPILFSFPLHISEVRAEYDRSGGSSANTTMRLPAFGSKLRLPAMLNSDLHEVEPSLNPAASAVTAERTLDALLNVITNRRLRYVFILATDVKDRLFLASIVRKYCPECRLVFTDSDLLFGHPDFGSDLRGSIVASTYPLYSKNQCWSYPYSGKRAQRAFDNTSGYGYYNATIALLYPDDGDKLLEYGPPFPDLCPEVSPFYPPVWISIVGQGGIYPVAVKHVELEENRKNYPFQRSGPIAVSRGEENPKASLVPAHSTLWITTVLGVTLLACNAFFAYACTLFPRGGSPGQGKATESRGLMELFRPRLGQTRRQRFYLFVCLGSILVTFAFLSYIWLVPLASWLFDKSSPVVIHSGHHVMPGLLIALLLAMVVLVLARAFLAVVQLFTATRDLPRDAKIPAAPSPANHTRRHGDAKHPGEAPAAGDQPRPWRRSGPGDLARMVAKHRVVLFCAVLLMVLAIYLLTNIRTSMGNHRFPVDVEALFFCERATAMTSGVSAAMSVTLLGLAFYLWGYVQLKRLSFRERWHRIDPFPQPANGEAEGLKQLHQCKEIAESDLIAPGKALTVPWSTLLWLALAFVFCRIAGRFAPAVDGALIESVLLVALAALTMLIVASWMYLRKLWGSIRELLNAIALLPLQGAFHRIPRALTQSFGSYLSYARDGRRHAVNYREQQYDWLASRYGTIAKDLQTEASLPDSIKTALAKATQKLTPAANNCEKLSLAARTYLRLLLHIRNNPVLADKLLEKEPGRGAPETSGPGGGEEAGAAGGVAVRGWLARAEDFVVLEITVYLSQFFAQLRNIALFLSYSPLLMLLAITSYPFQPQRSWLLLAGGLIGLITFYVVRIITQTERSELMSRIQNTTPDRLNFHWTFLSHIALYTMPLLGVLVTVSSGASDLLHTFFDPLLQMMK